jgi:hypothetical protein
MAAHPNPTSRPAPAARPGSPPDRAAAAALALTGTLLASCASGQRAGAPPPGTTLYLWDTPPWATGRPAVHHTSAPDQVSYWKGTAGGQAKIRIDLSEQKAYFYSGPQLAGVAAVSSGDEIHRTPTGSFRVTEKNVAHRSNLYGDFVDPDGNVVVANVSAGEDRRPSGTQFRGASMPYFMRFNGAVGMHAGFLPGYPASHGCVRLPDWIARQFFDHAPVGTPVVVVH